MNVWAGLGRLTRDIELKTSNSGVHYCSFSIAVPRRFKKDGQPDTDFVNCKAFGKTAEFAAKYLEKGRQIAVTGAIQCGSYDKEGVKIYTTDIIVDQINFADSKKAENYKDGNETYTEGDDDGLPF